MSRKYLDEFFGEVRDRRTLEIMKPAGRFGEEAGGFMLECIKRKYAKYRSTLPNDLLQSPEDCWLEFYRDCVGTLEKAMDGPDMTDDAAFERYIRVSVDMWFLRQYGVTEDGRMRDAFRKRLERDKRHRFVNMGHNRWGLADGTNRFLQSSTVPERSLYVVASRYPLDIDARATLDENRKRMPNYGKPGQLENMLAAVLDAAQGALDLSALHRIVTHRASVLQVLSVRGLDDGAASLDIFPSGDVSVEERALGEDAEPPLIDDPGALVEEMKRRGIDWTRAYIQQHPKVTELLMEHMDNDPDTGKDFS